MKFAKRVFLAAGIYGLIVMLPFYFLENKIGCDFPPAITHPEHLASSASLWLGRSRF